MNLRLPSRPKGVFWDAKQRKYPTLQLGDLDVENLDGHTVIASFEDPRIVEKGGMRGEGGESRQICTRFVRVLCRALFVDLADFRPMHGAVASLQIGLSRKIRAKAVARSLCRRGAVSYTKGQPLSLRRALACTPENALRPLRSQRLFHPTDPCAILEGHNLVARNPRTS